MILEILKDLLNATKQIKVDESTCLHSYSKKSKCNRCVEICPYNALTRHGNVLTFNENCDDCGLCAGICPSRAIQIKEPSEKEIFQAVVEKNRKVSCNKINIKDTINISCIGSLSKDFVIAINILGLGENVIYDEDVCASCKRYEVMPQTYGEYKPKAMEIAKKLAFESLADQRANMDAQIDYNVEKREFLFKGINYAKSLPLRWINQYITLGFDWNSNYNDELDNPYLKYLFTIIEDKEVLESIISFHDYPKFNEACNMCGACEKLCPSKAISIREVSGGKKIEIDKEKCLSCSLCKDICFRKGVE